MSDQNHMPLLEALLEFSEKKPAYFRIPAHRFEAGLGEAFSSLPAARLDLSEAEGLDDLHEATGVIKDAQDLARDLWGSEQAWFLVNGTTCGNEAMVLSTAKEGDQIIVPRNVHKSVLMGMILSGAEPVYLNPEYLPDYHLTGSVTPESVEEAFTRAPRAKAVILVCPTYYGILSDLKTIARICHSHGAALCVDEAHGSHLYFSEHYPPGAITQGADLVAQSIHKTGGSFTQSSMLHRCSNMVPGWKIQESLHMVQSTSPSYLLMASLDSARHELYIHGHEHMEKQLELCEYTRNALEEIPGIRVLTRKMEGTKAIWRIDPSRLVFSATELGISGYHLHELLYDRFGVSCELSDEENVVAVYTWGNTKEDADRLIHGLRTLSREAGAENQKLQSQEANAGDQKSQSLKANAGDPELKNRIEYITELRDCSEKSSEIKTQEPKKYQSGMLPLPKVCMTPRQAWFAEKESIPLSQSMGRIAGEMVVPYPPGIPILCPGEVITREVLTLIAEKKADHCPFHGPADPDFQRIRVLPHLKNSLKSGFK